MENPIKIHDLGVPLFLETPICLTWISAKWQASLVLVNIVSFQVLSKICEGRQPKWIFLHSMDLLVSKKWYVNSLCLKFEVGHSNVTHISTEHSVRSRPAERSQPRSLFTRVFVNQANLCQDVFSFPHRIPLSKFFLEPYFCQGDVLGWSRHTVFRDPFLMSRYPTSHQLLLNSTFHG